MGHEDRKRGERQDDEEQRRPTCGRSSPTMPARVSAIAPATMYTVANAVAMTRPWLRCAAATCIQANAPSASHAERPDQPSALRYPDDATSRTEVHASAPANGSEITIVDVDIIIASTRPPAVAAARSSDSFRRKAYVPSPATNGFKRMKSRSASPGENNEKSSIGGA